MKMRSMFYSILFSATAFAFLANCSGNKKDDTDTASHDEHAAHDSTEHASGSTPTAEAAEPQFQVDATFQNQLASVFTSYVELKDAFVSSDASKVKTEAKETNESLTKVDMKLVSGAAHNDWMNYLTPLQNSLKEIQESSDIEAQRKAFSTLSDNLYKSVKAFGLGGKEAYYEFCPIAFNNEGAYWLSEQAQIKNPYFGDKMLTCGEVKEKLK
jgi:Cu(I)/Ag(I) efflux system membrane fusion protein